MIAVSGGGSCSQRGASERSHIVCLTSSPLSETETGEKTTKEEAVVENTTPDYAAGLVSTQVLLLCPVVSRLLSDHTNNLTDLQKLGSLNENPLPSTSYLPATPSMVPSSSYIPSSEAQPGQAPRVRIIATPEGHIN